jgi:hypothetical protein
MVPIAGSEGDGMIDLALWIAVSSQMMCDGSPHRRECVAAARQCLIEHSDIDRDAAFETCAELLDPDWWEE